MKNIIRILLILSFATTPAFAKNKDVAQNPRVAALAGEDLEMFNGLDSKQQDNIRKGVIEPGYNAWMVKLAIGEPFYRSEHHAIYKDYEEVWLYTKLKEEKNKSEENIIDTVTNWPSIHRVTRTKSCKVGDFFILFDRGVVDKITPEPSEKVYGSCEISTTEEFIPIVDGKPKEK